MSAASDLSAIELLLFAKTKIIMSGGMIMFLNADGTVFVLRGDPWEFVVKTVSAGDLATVSSAIREAASAIAPREDARISPQPDGSERVVSQSERTQCDNLLNSILDNPNGYFGTAGDVVGEVRDLTLCYKGGVITETQLQDACIILMNSLGGGHGGPAK